MKDINLGDSKIMCNSLDREDQKWLKIGRWTLIKKGQLEWWGREDINSSLHKSDYCEL